ncbi:hypothetical protein BaRGS_00021089 [Batillaria attramentaria]|uniref:Uncharacterized protein n=1 Tax=Batillaria attramentaria TaxID=370345 RepID=A0ABD0KL07_9CAEN
MSRVCNPHCASSICRLSVTGSSIHTDETGRADSDVTGSSQPLTVIKFKPQPDTVQQQRAQHAQLPSRKFQFSVWHDLRSSEIHGPELKAPRVRRGPAEKEKAFYLMVDEENNKIHHDLHGRQKDKHRDELETWEKAQDLQHRYQKSNLSRILGRLKHVTFLNLRDNSLLDLSAFTFTNCEYLNLDNNYLTSFKQLPTVRNVKYLSMTDNDVSSFSGLSSLRCPPLEELFLIGNPISFQVFAALPQLKFLDGVVKQEEDMQPPPPDPNPQQSSCAVS